MDLIFDMTYFHFKTVTPTSLSWWRTALHEPFWLWIINPPNFMLIKSE